MAQRVGRGIALLFHDRGTRRGWVVSSTPRPHFTTGKDPVPILQEARWAPESVWTGGRSRPHRDSIPDCPARSSVAIPTELPGPQLSITCIFHIKIRFYYIWLYKTQCVWVFSCIMISQVIRIIDWSNNFTVILEDARSEECVYGCSPAGMAGSNPAGAWISVCYYCCVLFSYRPLLRADQSSRGILPSAHVSLSVIRCNICSLHPQCLCRRSQTEKHNNNFIKKLYTFE